MLLIYKRFIFLEWFWKEIVPRIFSKQTEIFFSLLLPFIHIYDEKRERRNSWSKFSRDRLIGIFKFILGWFPKETSCFLLYIYAMKKGRGEMIYRFFFFFFSSSKRFVFAKLLLKRNIAGGEGGVNAVFFGWKTRCLAPCTRTDNLLHLRFPFVLLFYCLSRLRYGYGYIFLPSSLLF